MKLDSISIEKMCYRKDKLSYALTLLGLVANVFYFFTLYRNNNNFYYDYQMGISVIYNLLFMLFVFLSAEEIKNYHREFSVVLFVIAILQILRIFYYPTKAFDAGVLPQKAYNYIIIYLIISFCFIICGAIISFYKSTILNKYKKNLVKNEGE